MIVGLVLNRCASGRAGGRGGFGPFELQCAIVHVQGALNGDGAHGRFEASGRSLKDLDLSHDIRVHVGIKNDIDVLADGQPAEAVLLNNVLSMHAVLMCCIEVHHEGMRVRVDGTNGGFVT